MGFTNIGYGNIINDNQIVVMVSPDSAPSKRLVQTARDEGRIVDGTQGRRTRSVILTQNGMVVLSALQPETIAARIKNHDISDNILKGEENE
ncbi:MAG: DUF370 domain-containing protein [Butyrivibrio sp.]